MSSLRQRCDFMSNVVQHALILGMSQEQFHKLADTAWLVLTAEPAPSQETSVVPDADVATNASCSCKHSDTWRCAVARGLTSVSCGCRCHRATANRRVNDER